jgi:exosortase
VNTRVWTHYHTKLEREGWKAFAPLLLVASGLFAYHKLAEYDPGTQLRSYVDGTEGFFFTPSGSSPTLLLILAAWLLFRRRKNLYAAMRSPPGPGGTAIALCLLLPAVLLGVWAPYVNGLGLLVPSLSLAILGGGLLLGGRAGLRAILLPALFLVLAFPHPPVLLNQFIFPLQLMTAEITVWILTCLGIPSHLAGDLILTDHGKVFQVIESCAGLRSMETLVMSAIVYAEIFYRRGAQAVLLVVAAPLIGLVVNQLRVLSVVFNPYSSLGSIHTAQGIAMLVMGVLSIAALDAALSRLLPDRWKPGWVPPSPLLEAHGSAGRAAAAGRLLGLCAILTAIGGAALWLPAWAGKPEPVIPLSRLPARIGAWKVSGLPLDEGFLGSVVFSEAVHRGYSLGALQAEVFLGADNRLEPRTSLISPKTAVPGPGYTLIETHREALKPDGLVADVLLFQRHDTPILVYRWYQGVEALPIEVLRSALLLDRGPFRRPGRAIVVRASMSLPRARSEWASTQDSLRQLIRSIRRELEQIEPLPEARSAGAARTGP